MCLLMTITRKINTCYKKRTFTINFKIFKMSKITEAELKGLKEQEQKKSAILHDLGILQTQTYSLNHMYVELMVEQNNLKKELEETYGKVNIDLKDGSFKIIKDDDKKDK